MQVPLRVLIAEDSEDDARLLLRELQRAGYQPTYERVDTPAAMATALDRHAWDLVIGDRSEEHTSELQSQSNLVCRLLLEKKKVYTQHMIVSKCRDTAHYFLAVVQT